MAQVQIAADLANWSPPQRRRLVDGEVVVEKLSPIVGPKVLDPAGNVIERLPVHNGMANKSPTDPYRATILPEKLAAGFVYYAKCPLGVTESIDHLPPAIRYELDGNGKPTDRPRAPCMRAADGGKIGNDSPCTCILALEKHRKEKHALREARQEERTNRLAKLAERTAEANLNATTQMAEAAKALAAAAASQASGNAKGSGK